MSATADQTLLEELHEQRKTLLDEASELVEARKTLRATFEERDQGDEKPSDEERSAHIAAEEAFNEDFTRREDAIKALTRRIDEEELIELRKSEAARASRGTGPRVTSEPLTYRKDNEKDISYFGDLAATQVRGLSGTFDANGARERLERHGKEMDEVLVKRAQERERRAEEQIDSAEREFRGSFVAGVDRRGFDASPFERRVNPNRTDGQGGNFVPPIYLIEDYIPALRAGRVASNLARNLDLPQGTDSINIPKISTTTQVGVQSGDNAAVASQDLTDTQVTAPVKTLAGQEDVAIQLVEQSPGQIIDRVVMEDLMADYNRLVDRQVVSGTGSSGQILGILPAGNWSALGVTWTSGAPGPLAFNQVLGALASKVSYNRFNLTNFAYLLHGRRWFWFATTPDGNTTGRPLVNTSSNGFNPAAIYAGEVPEGLAGQAIFGPEVYISANVPTNDNTDGGGATRDVGIGAKWDDCWLFEGDLRTRVLPEVLSGTLEIRFQVYNYVAFLVRYGSSLAVATGTGFTPPASAIDTSITF